MPSNPAIRGADRREFDQAVAERDWDDMDARWALATHFLAFLSDLEDVKSGRWGDDHMDCQSAGITTVDLVLELMNTFGPGDATGQFHSYAKSCVP